MNIPSTANTTCQGKQRIIVQSTGEELGKKQEIKWVKINKTYQAG